MPPIVGYAPTRPAVAAAPSPRSYQPRRAGAAPGHHQRRPPPSGRYRRTRTLALRRAGALGRPPARPSRKRATQSRRPSRNGPSPSCSAGRDVLAAAQTGTGKTAAFTLPILDRLRPYANTSFSPARHPVRVLVLTPTRELAVQVSEAMKIVRAQGAPARVGRVRRRAAGPADQGAAGGRRDPRRHAGTAARPGGSEGRQPDTGGDPRPRRGGPDAGHGVHAGYPADPRPAAEPQADAPVLGHLLG